MPNFPKLWYVCTHPQACSSHVHAYISVKSLVHMLQLYLVYTFITKIMCTYMYIPQSLNFFRVKIWDKNFLPWIFFSWLFPTTSFSQTTISVKSRVYRLQLLCNTFITIVTTLVGWIPQVIVTVTCEVINTNYRQRHQRVEDGCPTFTYHIKFTLCILNRITVTLHCGFDN